MKTSSFNSFTTYLELEATPSFEKNMIRVSCDEVNFFIKKELIALREALVESKLSYG